MKRLLIAVLLAAQCLTFLDGDPPRVVAQEAPPALGSVVMDDPLTAPSVVVNAFECETGAVARQFTTEGAVTRVRGRCRPNDAFAALGFQPQYLRLQDGEIRAEVKLLQGGDRAGFGFHVRLGEGTNAFYYVNAIPALNSVQIGRAGAERGTMLSERRDAGVPLSASDWNTIAVRMQGPKLWVLVNDQPVLTAEDATYDGVLARLNVFRTGSPDDQDEAAIAVRNLRVSSLEGADLARSPTFSPPLSSVPEGMTPPTPGSIVLDDPLTSGGVVPDRPCPTGRAGNFPVAEGLRMSVRGKCFDTATGAFTRAVVPGLLIPDGTIQFDARSDAQTERSTLFVHVRATNLEGRVNSYALGFFMGLGQAGIYKNVDGRGTPLAERHDLAGQVSWGEWNTVSVRVEGTNLWLLLNDRPMLWAEDPQFATGGVMVTFARTGNPDDEIEASAVVRNMRVSAAEGAPTDRSPTYERP